MRGHLLPYMCARNVIVDEAPTKLLQKLNGAVFLPYMIEKKSNWQDRLPAARPRAPSAHTCITQERDTKFTFDWQAVHQTLISHAIQFRGHEVYAQLRLIKVRYKMHHNWFTNGHAITGLRISVGKGRSAMGELHLSTATVSTPWEEMKTRSVQILLYVILHTVITTTRKAAW